MNTRQKRLKEVYEHLRQFYGIHTKTQFAEALKYGRTTISAALNGKEEYLTDSLFKNICEAYRGTFNLDYLLTGTGQLLTQEEEYSCDEMEQMGKLTATRPRLPVTAAAGSLSEYIGGIYAQQCEQMPVVHSFPAYDFTIIVKGDSMEPKFEGGDEIACRRVEKIIEWGKAYIVDTNDGAFLKRIFDDGESIRCVSYNQDYPDFHVHKTDINGIYRVVGLLRI
jgi:SOS-response transcriptional repressor LexA